MELDQDGQDQAPLVLPRRRLVAVVVDAVADVGHRHAAGQVEVVRELKLAGAQLSRKMHNLASECHIKPYNAPRLNIHRTFYLFVEF